jgi:hypothetical protein
MIQINPAYHRAAIMICWTLSRELTALRTLSRSVSIDLAQVAPAREGAI